MKRELRARSASAQESSPPSCPLTTPSSAPAWPSTPTRWGASGNYLEKKSYNIAIALRDRRSEATLFARDLSIPFTNNEAESSLRMAKLHRKISGCFQGDDSAQHFAAIRSYIATARKHGVGALDVLARLFCGDVWTPPATT